MKKVVIYSNGLVYCSVCADASLSFKEVEKEVNIINMTGIDGKWKVSKENFNGGAENPRPCDDDPKRKHYLMVC